MPQLPSPSDLAIAHSIKLIEQIRQRIAAEGGAISFAEYMQLALYAPGLGYYVAGQTKFGRGGDFITAPELGPYFAGSLANFLAPRLSELGQEALVIEFGAGSGQLAADLLQRLATLDQLPSRYCIVEVSPELQQRQYQKLKMAMPEYIEHIEWWTELPKQAVKACVIANEVLDAMPVVRFEYDGEQFFEVMVGYQDDRFVDSVQPLAKHYAAQLAQLPINNAPYRSEFNPQLSAWLQAVSNCISEGYLLLIDYGYEQSQYYLPERSQGTLQCHYRHLAHSDPYVYPGLQDITAHVDFTALMQAASQLQLDCIGYSNQAEFLLAHGLLEQLPSPDSEEFLLASQTVKKLTLPTEMGELFKVLALRKTA